MRTEKQWVECDCCGLKADIEDEDKCKPLEEVEDLLLRIEVGGVVPAGECRECGALMFAVTEKERKD